MLRPMDTQQALADLTEISSQIQAAVVFDDKGKVAGSTLGDESRAGALALAAVNLLTAAEEIRTGESPLTQLEVATGEGSVFVVREGKTAIAATTSANPTVGLVFYDLKSALRSVKPAAKRPVRAKRGQGEGVRGNREVPPTEEKASPAARKTGAAPKKKAAASKRKTATRKKPDAS
jgi:predicted regulator of Ras-like GTPase activity (Roadblock/LC7/MglB family)